MATWNSNGSDTGGSGGYVSGTQGVQYIHDNFAANGDTITIPTGLFTWNTGVSITKPIFLFGSGYTPNPAINGSSPGAPVSLPTQINFTANGSTLPNNSFALSVPCSSVGGGNYFRLSGIHFIGLPGYDGTHDWAYINIFGSTTTDPFRIDNCFFDGGNSKVIMFQTTGNTVGCVVDHCTFVGSDGSEMIHNFGTQTGSTAGWSDNITPGSNQLLYFEDCEWEHYNWNTISNMNACSGIESYYGARDSIRYSTFRMSQIDQHGNWPPNYGTRWWEFYNNTHVTGAANASTVYDVVVRGGSGFIYNVTNSPPGATQLIQVYSDESPNNAGWLGYCQCGPGAAVFLSGAAQSPDNLSPAYLWGIASGIGVQTQFPFGSNDIAANRNYFVSTNKPTINIYQKTSGPQSNITYNPFTYPHPLTGIIPGNIIRPMVLRF